MNDAVRALIAGLGAGATSLGTSIGNRDEAKRAELVRQAAADKAFQQLLASKDYEASIAPPTTRVVEDGVDPVTNAPREKYQQFNRTTQQWEDAVDTTPSTASAPSAPPQTGMHPAIAALAGKMVPDRTPPIASAMPGNPVAPPVAVPPVATPIVQPDRPTPRVLRPPPKAAPTITKTPRTFSENGQPVEGFSDQTGKFYHADGSPVTGKVTPYVKADEPGNIITTGIGADGKPYIVTGKNRGDPNLKVTGIEKPTAAGGGSGASLSPEDRGKLLAQAKIDNAEMKRIEKRVLDGQLNFGTAAGLAGAASQAHGGVGSEMVGVVGNAAAGAIDPDIQRYFTAQSSYGRIMGNLQSKRYTDHQADIERRISGMAGNDLKNTIAYKQQLRDASIDDPAVQPSKKGAYGTPTKAQQLWDAAVAKHGEATVLKEFGPRPPS